jgi:hypothetical protein
MIIDNIAGTSNSKYALSPSHQKKTALKETRANSREIKLKH